MTLIVVDGSNDANYTEEMDYVWCGHCRDTDLRISLPVSVSKDNDDTRTVDPAIHVQRSLFEYLPRYQTKSQ